MRARWAAVALVLATALTALTGCGGSDESRADQAEPTATSSASGTPSPTATESADSSEPAEEGCPYLTAEQVTAVLGADTTETAGTVHACFFDPVSGEGPSVMLSRVDIQIDPAEYAVQSKALCQGDVTDVDAGDEAFACVMGLGPQGQLYDGPVLIAVAVDDAADEAAGIASIVELLPEITVPPAS
jgi:hypothetical protein